MRVAIIDIGTNTFNLLIAEKQQADVKIIYQDKLPVMLGQATISINVISSESFQRGLDALTNYASKVKEFSVNKIAAYATSAIRSAINGGLFVDTVKQKTGISIEVISGDKEAELIYLGVKEAIEIGEQPVLILDVGGGSNELIIADSNQIFWKCSYNLGIARLLERFKPSNPITDNEISSVESYLETEMQSLFNEIKKYNIHTLIGSSGSFDTFADMIALRYSINIGFENDTEYTFDLNQFFEIHRFLIQSTKEQRMADKSIVPMRVDMIVLASILVNFVIKKTGIKCFRMSAYSLKEGALFDLLK